MMLHTKYQGSVPRVSDKNIGMFFPINAYVKNVTPGAGPLLAPGA